MQKQQLDTLLFDLLRQRQAQNTSSQESASIEQLEEIKGNLEQLISRLAISTPQLTPPKTAPFTYQNPTPSENLSSSQLPTAADGRYRLSNNSLALDLHIDRKKCGIITGDLYATVLDFRGESNAYIGSFRSKRGANLTSWEPSLPITAYDADGQSASGTLTFTLVAGKELALQLSLETKIRNLPVDQPITFSGRILSNKSREISIEMEQEVGCQPIEGHSSSGEKYSIKRCLEQAGFEVSQYGRNLAIPTPPLGNWDSGQLHNLHLQLSKDAEERHPLHFNAILLKHHSKPGVVAEQLL
ncbi:MAG: hypothetical protein KDK40_04395, partial [Chlamydiia bacterium]|nr:hypothetical protein [Chlamydiia bacterium]